MMKLLLTMMVLFGFLLADDGEKKVVIDLTAGDVATYEKKILSGIVAHKGHYESSLEELEVTVVIHGGAYKFFVENLDVTVYKDDVKLQKVFKEFKTRTRSLAETYDVEFLLCNVGRKKHKLERSNIADYVKIVPNSTIGLIDKQSEGYAYIPVGD